MPALLDGPSPPLMNQGPSEPEQETVPDEDAKCDVRLVRDMPCTRTWNVKRHVPIDCVEAIAMPLLHMRSMVAIAAPAATRRRRVSA